MFGCTSERCTIGGVSKVPTSTKRRRSHERQVVEGVIAINYDVTTTTVIIIVMLLVPGSATKSCAGITRFLARSAQVKPVRCKSTICMPMGRRTSLRGGKVTRNCLTRHKRHYSDQFCRLTVTGLLCASPAKGAGLMRATKASKKACTPITSIRASGT